MITLLTKTINVFFYLLELLILADVILSWIPVSGLQPVKKVVSNLTEPLLGTIRKLLEKSIIGGKGMTLDFSPIIAIILIRAIKVVLINLLK